MFQLSKIYGKKIALVDMLTEKDKLFSDIAGKTIQKYKKLGKKILFISSKKGYSTSLMCVDCGYIPKCDYCDIPIGKHKVKAITGSKDDFFYMCPICKRLYKNIIPCKKCNSLNVKDIGVGSYRLKEILADKFGIEARVIENTDINKISKIKSLKIKNEQFIISTSIFSVANDFKPDIIIFMNPDVGLLIPDYNVSEKHFMFLYDFLTNYSTSNFIIQTFNFQHYVYRFISKLDINGFWKEELKLREKFNYPPFSELAVLIYKHEIEEKLYFKISKVESELKYLIQKFDKNIEIFPTPQLIYKKFGKYHYNIILKGKNLKSFLDKVVGLLKLRQKGFQIDWLPSNLI